MKITAVNWQGRPRSKRLRQLLVTGRTFAVLSICSTFFFILIGFAVMANNSLASSPDSSMKGFAASVSNAFFSDMLGMEMASFKGTETSEAFSGPKTAAFLMRLLTDVNPGDPKSLIARELPGLQENSAILMRSGVATDASVGPVDDQPISDNEAGGGDAADGTDPGTGDAGKDVKPGQDPQSPVPDPAVPTTGGRKVVFIYHSHSRESYRPELKSSDADPNSSTINVSLVGKRLAQKLEEQGIGTLQSTTDYPSVVKDYKWALSYKYSSTTVKEAIAGDPDLKFFFDIHRDSQPRKYTTATIGGTDYAQVYFIVGHRNPNWQKNEAFATQIHEALEKDYPGISRGIWGKTAATGNGEYNQSLSPDSILIEIGGIDNTLEECYRTADALAKEITAIYWDAEKVDAGKGS